MGYIMLIIYAGVRNIPEIYNEAASIDGATAFQKFRYLTLAACNADNSCYNRDVYDERLPCL